jgi:pimeloyl-ACP methyl ester carboxylesterase
MQSDTVSVPGGTLYYELRGAGPILLLIPGGRMDARVFGPLAERLADRYTVVTYDCRGDSRSSHTGAPDELTAELHADDADRLLEVVGDEPSYVLGSGSGAIHGLELVARYPDRVLTVVAHEPVARHPPDLPALRASATRIVVGVGVASTPEQAPYRSAHALADGLGVAPVTFPGGHSAFASDPDAFANRSQEVLLYGGAVLSR